jgi:hypothetical protein
MIQAMSALGGTFMSQWNGRAVCGAQLKGAVEMTLDQILPKKTPPDAPALYGWEVGMPLNQSGPPGALQSPTRLPAGPLTPRGACLPGWCEVFGDPNYNAQVEFEPLPDLDLRFSGDNDFASSGTCLRNARMRFDIFSAQTQLPGLEGYKQFISWIKARLIAGQVVSIGVFDAGDDDEQYDHEVTVLRMGTNHEPDDASYYDDDVLYFDDHGVYTLALINGKWKFTDNPSVPPGVNDPSGCTPYVFGYRVDQLGPLSREQANDDAAPAYSLVSPGVSALTSLGGDGVHANVAVTTRSWGFASPGHVDEDGLSLPVSVHLSGSSTAGVPNAPDALAGFNYENPMVGDGLPGDTDGDVCTNAPPPFWMDIELTVRVSKLQTGVTYNLYEYLFDGITSPGPGTDATAAALAVPTRGFNAAAALATHVTQFTATGETYTHIVQRVSSQVVVFRCVPATAP